jgi:hypothetical protein
MGSRLVSERLGFGSSRRLFFSSGREGATSSSAAHGVKRTQVRVSSPEVTVFDLAPVIRAWAVNRPWPTLVAVEQDLVLARLIVEFAQHSLLGQELVFRGGTCLHQLVLDRPRRYSEDLDFVRSTHSPVGPIFDAIREVAGQVGLDVAGTKVGEHPKVRLRAPSETDSATLRIKIELNTHETSPALPTVRMPFTVSSAWFSGTADVQTFAVPELFATKIRAQERSTSSRRSKEWPPTVDELELKARHMGVHRPGVGLFVVRNGVNRR